MFIMHTVTIINDYLLIIQIFNLTFEKSFTDHDSFDFVYTSARSDID